MCPQTNHSINRCQQEQAAGDGARPAPRLAHDAVLAEPRDPHCCGAALVHAERELDAEEVLEKISLRWRVPD